MSSPVFELGNMGRISVAYLNKNREKCGAEKAVQRKESSPVGKGCASGGGRLNIVFEGQ
jgi:hypothetical protein